MRRARRSDPLPRVESTVDLEVRHLRAFVTLAELGRVTATAQALGLAQSTVSEALAALERALATRMIIRRRGGHEAILTEAGEALLPRARRILAAIDDARLAVARATRSARAHVRIVANESVSTYVLPAVLAPLRKHWPNTRFGVSVATGVRVREGIAGGGFDVGLLLETYSECSPASRSAHAPAVEPPAVRRTVVCDVRLVMFASASHPAGRGAVSRGALAECPLFVSDAALDFQAFVRRYGAGNRRVAPHIQAAGSVEGVKRAVIADPRALGLLPEYAIADELSAGRVVELDLRPRPPRVRLAALLSRSRASHPASAQLIDGIREMFASAAR